MCVAFLLFPVISTSDDLHATDFVEDAAFASRKARPGVSSHVLNQGGVTIFVVPMSASVAPPAISSEAAVHFSSVLTLAGVLLPRAGRSPPFRFSRQPSSRSESIREEHFNNRPLPLSNAAIQPCKRRTKINRIEVSGNERNT